MKPKFEEGTWLTTYINDNPTVIVTDRIKKVIPLGETYLYHFYYSGIAYEENSDFVKLSVTSSAEQVKNKLHKVAKEKGFVKGAFFKVLYGKEHECKIHNEDFVYYDSLLEAFYVDNIKVFSGFHNADVWAEIIPEKFDRNKIIAYRTLKEMPLLPIGAVFTYNQYGVCYECNQITIPKDVVESDKTFFAPIYKPVYSPGDYLFLLRPVRMERKDSTELSLYYKQQYINTCVGKVVESDNWYHKLENGLSVETEEGAGNVLGSYVHRHATQEEIIIYINNNIPTI